MSALAMARTPQEYLDALTLYVLDLREEYKWLLKQTSRDLPPSQRARSQQRREDICRELAQLGAEGAL